MSAPTPRFPCPWCQGCEFVVVENVFLEITDYGRAFDAVTCQRCGHTAFFTRSAMASLTGRNVRVPESDAGPYR